MQHRHPPERAPLAFKHAGVVILRIPGADHDLADGFLAHRIHVIEGAAAAAVRASEPSRPAASLSPRLSSSDAFGIAGDIDLSPSGRHET